MTVLCHPSHPLAQGGTVSPEDLGGEAFVDFHPDWGPRRTTDAAFTEAGVQRTVPLEVSDVHSLLELVHEGLGVAVVPRHFGLKREAATLVSLPVKGSAVYETVAMLPPHEATSPAARALMSLLAADTEGGPESGDRRPAPGEHEGPVRAG
jgi:DNA-binding transcriptional LysR family regulator